MSYGGYKGEMIESLIHLSCYLGAIVIYAIGLIALTGIISHLFDVAPDAEDMWIASNMIQLFIVIGFIVYELSKVIG